MNTQVKGWGIPSILAVFLLVVSLSSCQSDLLGNPPSTVAISLTAAPTVTPGADSATITVVTSAAATVSVEYGTVSGTYARAVPRTSVEGTSHSVNLTGLASSTTYYYRVVAWLNGIRYFYSPEYFFATLAAGGTPTLSITTGPTVTPTLTALSIAFTTNEAATFIVEFGTTTGNYTQSTPLTTTAATSHTASLTGLTPGTTYFYRIRLFGGAGSAVVSGEFTAATTAETPPTAAQRARGIWVLGGLSGSAVTSALAPVDLFDPVTSTWFPGVTNVPTPVSFAGYAAADGRLFVFGGFDSSGVVQNIVQIYTIATNTWTSGSVMPAARANIHAAVTGGKVYIMGGTTTNASIAWAASMTNFEYLISGNSWNTRFNFAAAAASERFTYALNDVVYNIGGRSAAAAVAAPAHDAYSFVNNALTGAVETAMATPRSGVAGALYTPPSGGTPVVLLVGGVSAFTGTNGSFVNQGTTVATLSNLVQFLASPFAAPSVWTVPATGAITFPSLVAYGAAVTSTAGVTARFYHFGGTQALGGSAMGQNAVYWCDVSNLPVVTPATWANVWNLEPIGMPRPRWGHGAVTLNQ